jgi:hypothetical protein
LENLQSTLARRSADPAISAIVIGLTIEGQEEAESRLYAASANLAFTVEKRQSINLVKVFIGGTLLDAMGAAAKAIGVSLYPLESIGEVLAGYPVVKHRSERVYIASPDVFYLEYHPFYGIWHETTPVLLLPAHSTLSRIRLIDSSVPFKGDVLRTSIVKALSSDRLAKRNQILEFDTSDFNSVTDEAVRFGLDRIVKAMNPGTIGHQPTETRGTGFLGMRWLVRDMNTWTDNLDECNVALIRRALCYFIRGRAGNISDSRYAFALCLRELGSIVGEQTASDLYSLFRTISGYWRRLGASLLPAETDAGRTGETFDCLSRRLEQIVALEHQGIIQLRYALS